MRHGKHNSASVRSSTIATLVNRTVLLQIPDGGGAPWGASDSFGKELRGDAKNLVDELTLSDRIALRDPADLALSDGMHRLVPFDRPVCTLH